MTLAAGVITFPGSNCDRDMAVAIEAVTGKPALRIWHGDAALPDRIDFIAVPGGFSVAVKKELPADVRTKVAKWFASSASSFGAHSRAGLLVVEKSGDGGGEVGVRRGDQALGVHGLRCLVAEAADRGDAAVRRRHGQRHGGPAGAQEPGQAGGLLQRGRTGGRAGGCPAGSN